MTVQIKEKPILFSSAMVRAILEGRKTQTRRVRVTQSDNHPRYQVGDHLWVRETFYVQPDLYDPKVPTPIHYKADAGLESYEDYILKPSIFMPRWASRITLEVTEVRAQRVQEITEDDAISEGLIRNGTVWGYGRGWYKTPIDAYAALWSSINKKRGYGWDVNPWVWAYTFKRLVNEH